MSEVMLQWMQFLKLLLLAGVATLYGFGGVSGKWKRRFIAPAVLLAGIVGFSLWMGTFAFWYLFCYPLLLGAFSLGYGVNSSMMKLFKSKIIVRGIVGLAIAIAALPIVIINAAWLLFGFHVALCIATMIILGVWNPTQSARAEETMIGFVAGFIPLMGMI